MYVSDKQAAFQAANNQESIYDYDTANFPTSSLTSLNNIIMISVFAAATAAVTGVAVNEVKKKEIADEKKKLDEKTALLALKQEELKKSQDANGAIQDKEREGNGAGVENEEVTKLQKELKDALAERDKLKKDYENAKADLIIKSNLVQDSQTKSVAHLSAASTAQTQAAQDVEASRLRYEASEVKVVDLNKKVHDLESEKSHLASSILSKSFPDLNKYFTDINHAIKHTFLHSFTSATDAETFALINPLVFEALLKTLKTEVEAKDFATIDQAKLKDFATLSNNADNTLKLKNFLSSPNMTAANMVKFIKMDPAALDALVGMDTAENNPGGPDNRGREQAFMDMFGTADGVVLGKFLDAMQTADANFATNLTALISWIGSTADPLTGLHKASMAAMAGKITEDGVKAMLMDIATRDATDLANFTRLDNNAAGKANNSAHMAKLIDLFDSNALTGFLSLDNAAIGKFTDADNVAARVQALANVDDVAMKAFFASINTADAMNAFFGMDHAPDQAGHKFHTALTARVAAAQKIAFINALATIGTKAGAIVVANAGDAAAKQTAISTAQAAVFTTLGAASDKFEAFLALDNTVLTALATNMNTDVATQLVGLPLAGDGSIKRLGTDVAGNIVAKVALYNSMKPASLAQFLTMDAAIRNVFTAAAPNNLTALAALGMGAGTEANINATSAAYITALTDTQAAFYNFTDTVATGVFVGWNNENIQAIVNKLNPTSAAVLVGLTGAELGEARFIDAGGIQTRAMLNNPNFTCDDMEKYIALDTDIRAAFTHGANAAAMLPVFATTTKSMGEILTAIGDNSAAIGLAKMQAFAAFTGPEMTNAVTSINGNANAVNKLATATVVQINSLKAAGVAWW